MGFAGITFLKYLILICKTCGGKSFARVDFFFFNQNCCIMFVFVILISATRG